jgi:hypothetical protein
MRLKRGGSSGYFPIFLAIVAGGAIGLFGLAHAASQSDGRQTQGPELIPAQDSGQGGSEYLFGNTGSVFRGWQMPEDTLLTTSFVTTQSVHNWLVLSINVFPFEAAQNTTLYLGLYVNGQLVANNSDDVSQNHAHQAVMEGQPVAVQGSRLANFSSSLEAYAVSVELSDVLPVGTTVSLAAIVTSPIWIQTGSSGSTSHLTPDTAMLPASIPQALLSTEAAGVSAAAVDLSIDGSGI